MSVKVSSWVWHGDETSELSGNEMILMLALADVADDSGRCRFLADDEDLSYGSLSRKARVSRSTLIRLLTKLREVGLVEQAKGVKGRPNEFRIVVPWASGFGSNLEPNAKDSVSSGANEVSSEPGFGLISDVRSSSIDVLNVGDVVQAHGFDEFWAIWPKKNSRRDAERAWDKAVKKAPSEVILAAARAYAESPYRPEKQFVPYGATWLNGERWSDPLPEPRGGAKPTPDQRFLDGMNRGARLQALVDAEQKGITA